MDKNKRWMDKKELERERPEVEETRGRGFRMMNLRGRDFLYLYAEMSNRDKRLSITCNRLTWQVINDVATL